MPTKVVTHMFTPQSEIADAVRSTVRLVTDPALDNVTGRYFDVTREARALAQAYDERARARLRTVAPAGESPLQPDETALASGQRVLRCVQRADGDPAKLRHCARL